MNFGDLWFIIVFIMASFALTALAIIADKHYMDRVLKTSTGRSELMTPREQIVEIIAEVLCVNAFEVVDEKKIDDLGADEISKAEIIIAIEEQMKIEISEEEVQAVEKVKDLIAIVEKKTEARV
jgi:acyl carrier protein